MSEVKSVYAQAYDESYIDDLLKESEEQEYRKNKIRQKNNANMYADLISKGMLPSYEKEGVEGACYGLVTGASTAALAPTVIATASSIASSGLIATASTIASGGAVMVAAPVVIPTVIVGGVVGLTMGALPIKKLVAKLTG